MLIALDSATRQAGLALYEAGALRAEVLWAAGVHHTEWLAPALEAALQRARVTMEQVEAVAVTTGPGSFTGLRVAISLAKGIAAARAIPLLGIPTLDVTAYPHAGERPLLATLQAGRGRHAFAWYRRAPTGALERLTEAELAPIQGVADSLRARLDEGPIRVAGELSPAERAHLQEVGGAAVEVLSPALAVRRPAVLAELAWQRLAAGESDDLHALEPTYLHLPARA